LEVPVICYNYWRLYYNLARYDIELELVFRLSVEMNCNCNCADLPLCVSLQSDKTFNGNLMASMKSMKNMEFFEETPLYIAVLTYIGYGILIIFGHFRDFMRKWNLEKVTVASEYLTSV
jgi:hypothetical protein